MSSGLHKYDIDPADLDPNGIAESQTVTADDLALDGALCDLGTALQFDIGDAYSADITGVRLLFDAAGDINTAVFTITGLDENGNSVTEAVTGVTTTAVSTVNYYSQVTVIAVTVATATAVFVGTVTGELVTKVVPINHLSRIAAAYGISDKTGTFVVDLQLTMDDFRLGLGTLNWIDWVANISGDTAGVLNLHTTGARLKFVSYSNGAELQFHVSDNPYR